MATGKKFKEEIAKLNYSELVGLRTAFQNLREFRFFWNEYRGQGLDVISSFIDDRIAELVKKEEIK